MLLCHSHKDDRVVQACNMMRKMSGFLEHADESRGIVKEAGNFQFFFYQLMHKGVALKAPRFTLKQLRHVSV
jgi:hypothetical protein